MQGTWKTKGGGGGGVPWQFALVILIGAAAMGVAGAVETVTLEFLPWILAAVTVIVFAVGAGLGWLVWRRVTGRSVHLVPRPVIVRAPETAALPRPERPAIEQAAQHLHLHFEGTDPGAVADILRRAQRPE